MKVMERQDRFDEAIKGKIGTLEDEPSARVWAGVSATIGATEPIGRNPWIFRVAAAAAILVAIGVGYLLLPYADTMPRALAVKEKTRAPRFQVVPQDYLGKKDVYLAEDQAKSTPEPMKNHPQPSTYPSLANHTPKAPQNEIPVRDSLKSNVPSPFGPGPDPMVPEKSIAQDGLPKLDGPQSPSPDEARLKPQPERLLEDEDGKAFASATTKRSFRVPGREDLRSGNLRKHSGAILGAVTNGANQYLGLDASYAEQESDDMKMTAFNADFGLFKIKRVKTVKE